tara:strand:+ start:9114 stop:9443 length:330 start_codon:yes stop_codon:yes gene_type:complete
MSSRNKAKGTRFETDVVNFINEKKPYNVERRALSGANDKGDIIGVPDFALECKNVKDWSKQLGAFVQEAEIEAGNAGVPFGAVVIKKRNSNTSRSYVVMSLEKFVELMP